jgi:single-stranded-DNA-specific exonuclease
MEKTWTMLEPDQVKAANLHAELKISPIICRVLINRGIETFESAKKFFRSLSDLHDRWFIKYMRNDRPDP